MGGTLVQRTLNSYANYWSEFRERCTRLWKGVFLVNYLKKQRQEPKLPRLLPKQDYYYYFVSDSAILSTSSCGRFFAIIIYITLSMRMSTLLSSSIAS